VIILNQNTPKCVWRPGSARTRWGSLSAPPDLLAVNRRRGRVRKGEGGKGKRGKGKGRGRRERGGKGKGRKREGMSPQRWKWIDATDHIWSNNLRGTFSPSLECMDVI